MAEPLRSPQGQKPSSLASPVPGREAEIDLLEQFEIQATTPAGPAVDLGQAEPAPVEGVPAPAPEAVPDGLEQFEDISQVPTAEDPTFIEANVTQLQKQLDDIPLRVAANLGKTQEGARLALVRFLGENNVRVKDNEIEIRKKGETQFRRLDPDTFEVVNDLFSDLYRENISGLFGTAAVVAQGPGALEPATSAAGFIAGTAVGELSADVLAERVLGIPRDPGRPQGALGRTGEALTEGAIAVVAKGAFDKIGSTVGKAIRRNRELRKLNEGKASDRLNDIVKQNLETHDEMLRNGAVQKLPGGDLAVPAHQLLPGTEASGLAKSLVNNKGLQNAQAQAAKQLDEAVTELVETSAQIGPGSLREVLKKGIPQARPDLAKNVTGLFDSVRKREGVEIGKFTAKATAQARKQALPTAKTGEAMQDILKRLGARLDPKGNLVLPADEQMAQILGTDSKLIIRGFKQDLRRLNDKLVKGGLNISEFNGEVDLIGNKNIGARRVGGIYKQMIGKLSSSIRADRREGVKLMLDPEDARLYDAAMDKFRAVARSTDTLSKILDTELGANTFVNGLLTKGKAGLPQLRAAKEFLLQEDPKLWNEIKGEFLEELFLRARESKVGSPLTYNVGKVRRELFNKFGNEYLDEIFGKQAKGQILRAMDLSEQLQQTLLKGTDNEVEKVARNLFQALSQFVSAKLNATYAFFRFGTRNARLAKIISRKGVDEFLEDVPKAERGKMRAILQGIGTYMDENGFVEGIKATAAQIPTAQGAQQAGQATTEFLGLSEGQ